MSGIVKAQVIVNDNFDTLANGHSRNANGQYSTGSSPSTWWYVNTSTGFSTWATSSPAATGNFSGNWIETPFNAGGGNMNDAVSPFSSVKLANVGDSLTVQFDFRYNGSPNGGHDRNPEFGFFNGTVPTADMTTLPAITAGYNANAITGESDGSGIVQLNKNSTTLFSDIKLVSASAGTAFDGAYTMNFKLVLTKTAANSTKIDLYLNNVLTCTATDTSSANFTYDEFILRARDLAQIDNFSMTASNSSQK